MNDKKRICREEFFNSENIGWKFPIWVILATLSVIALLYCAAYYLKNWGG